MANKHRLRFEFEGNPTTYKLFILEDETLVIDDPVSLMTPEHAIEMIELFAKIKKHMVDSKHTKFLVDVVAV